MLLSRFSETITRGTSVAVPRTRLWLLTVALAVSGCTGPFPQSTLHPRSDFARAVILVFDTVPTVRTIFATAGEAPPPDALKVEVIGHQWWWEYRYPDLGIVTANELHLPVGIAVRLELISDDVIHDFWVPRIGWKK